MTITADVRSTRAGPVEVAALGAGPAVLLVHGTPGSWRQALPLADDLAGSHRALLVSRPGYGATPCRGRSSSEAQADLYAALLDELGIDQAAVVGISGGGPSSVAMAVRHPDRVSALVLCCAVAPHATPIPWGLRGPFVWPGTGAALAALGRWHAASVLRRPASIDRALGRSLTPAERAELEGDGRVRHDLVGFFRGQLDAPAAIAAVRRDIRGWVRAGAGGAPDLTAIAAPTLVLHGDHDGVVPLEAARFHATAIAGAELEVYEGGGHAFILTFRRAVTARISAFLDGVAATP